MSTKRTTTFTRSIVVAAIAGAMALGAVAPANAGDWGRQYERGDRYSHSYRDRDHHDYRPANRWDRHDYRHPRRYDRIDRHHRGHRNDHRYDVYGLGVLTGYLLGRY